MENELVTEFKKSCKLFDEEVRAYYDKIVARGANEEDIDDIVDIMYGNYDLLKGTTKANLETGKVLLRDQKNKFANKKAFIDGYLDAMDKSEVDEEVVEATAVEAKPETKSKGGKIFAGVVAGVLLAGTAVHTGLLLKNKKVNCTGTTNKEETIETTESEINKSTETEEVHLMPGEYGTFTELTEEQIHDRAQYLYDNVYAKMDGFIDYNRLSMMFGEHKNYISVEGIENVIRSMNGIPRVNENGEYYVSANMADEILNEAAFYLFGVPSACYDQNNMKLYHNVPAHLFVLDNSESSRFLKGYDDAYQAFSDAMNQGSYEKSYEAAQTIATKMFYEWHMDGVFGDQNPYLLNAEQLKLARMCSVDKWVNYVYEFEQDAQTAICVDVCVDYNTKELSTLKGDEIQQAITYDLWEDTVAISAGMLDEVQQSKIDHGTQYENQVFVDYLMNEINYQYENNYKGKTVSQGNALTLK